MASAIALALGSAGPALADTAVQSRADAAPAQFSTGGAPNATFGGSSAWYPGNAGPNTGGVSANAQLSGSVAFGGSNVALSGFVNLGGPLTSRSTASSPIDTDAASGALGSNLSFQPGADPAQPATIDLLAAGGNSAVPSSVADQVTLQLGAFASETRFVNGQLQPDQYRVGQADLVVHSPAVKDAAAQLYQALGAVDRDIEQTVSQNVPLTTLKNLVGGTLPTPTLTVHSNTRDKIFSAFLAKPLTSHNRVVTIDFSTGTVTVHLDQIPAGGINSQPANKELVNSSDYPLIATTVHDLMHDATNIAIGTIEHSLDAVQIGLNWSGPLGPSDTVNVSWNFSLQQAVTGTMPRATNNSTGLVGSITGTTLVTTLNTLTIAGNAVGQLFLPAYNLIIANGGNGVFDLLINQIKFGFTSSVVNMLQPVFGMAAQVVSVQVNHQTTSTCTTSGGAQLPNAHSISAFSIGFLQSSNAARLDLGQSASSVTLADCR
ncbi:choice-of-anchor G family protein [Sinomonas sp. ASV322]|uniref:choice-of-anchor G family protein n=1 Tax=Sinomonas sp. ASV322 TaxID=3041920 RepID=UPI0027DB20AD|nr:choice-of-anchor G family protein [Sinomonas sp. ASV322]MDQ4503476.1 choice-of-anchor G family protein [Sinomonas sp. ASV322]